MKSALTSCFASAVSCVALGMDSALGDCCLELSIDIADGSVVIASVFSAAAVLLSSGVLSVVLASGLWDSREVLVKAGLLEGDDASGGLPVLGRPGGSFLLTKGADSGLVAEVARSESLIRFSSTSVTCVVGSVISLVLSLSVVVVLRREEFVLEGCGTAGVFAFNVSLGEFPAFSTVGTVTFFGGAGTALVLLVDVGRRPELVEPELVEPELEGPELGRAYLLVLIAPLRGTMGGVLALFWGEPRLALERPLSGKGF